LTSAGQLLAPEDNNSQNHERSAHHVRLPSLCDIRLFILGNLERPLRQFSKLAGIEVSRIY